MCGRMAQTLPAEFIVKIFEILGELPKLHLTWNLAPSQEAAVVRRNPKTGERSLDALKWGLVPSWVKEEHTPFSTINAKAEELADKPSFRDAWQKQRRCIIPVNHFYEWQPLDKIQNSDKKQKQPYAIGRADGQPTAIAGLWEGKYLTDGSVLRTFTIITCKPNAAMSPIHNRMPVILEPEDWSTWLGENHKSENQIAALMRPCPDESLKIWPISNAIGNTRNDFPKLAEPIQLS